MTGGDPLDDGESAAGKPGERIAPDVIKSLGPLQRGEAVTIRVDEVVGEVLITRTGPPAPGSDSPHSWWRTSLIIAGASGLLSAFAAYVLTGGNWRAALVTGPLAALAFFLLVFFRNPRRMMRRTFIAVILASVAMSALAALEIEMNFPGLGVRIHAGFDWRVFLIIVPALMVSGILAYQEAKSP